MRQPLVTVISMPIKEPTVFIKEPAKNGPVRKAGFSNFQNSLRTKVLTSNQNGFEFFHPSQISEYLPGLITG
jgi:hypothetical protein